MTFEDWLKFVLQSNVVAALVVGLFGIVSLKLGLGEFRSEKWWERKAAAYVSTFEAMHAIYSYEKILIDAEGAGHELTQSYLNDLSEGSVKGFLEVRKAASLAPFLMSKRASMIISEMVRHLSDAPADFCAEIAPLLEGHSDQAIRSLSTYASGKASTAMQVQAAGPVKKNSRRSGLSFALRRMAARF